MNYDPLAYARFERTPIGCFSAEMEPGGWAKTKFDHDMQEHLLSDELSEFIRFVHHFFKECPDWTKLDKYKKKYGTEIMGDDYTTTIAFNYSGDLLDYTVHLGQTSLKIFPYRKIRH